MAFLQWRVKYPTPLRCDEETLKDMINQRREIMYDKLTSDIKPHNLPDDKYKCDEKFNSKFEGAIKRAKCFNIWSFEQIGMFDPYPEEQMETTFAIPQSDKDLVYRIDRYVKGNSPNAIYFPSKMVLFKIMRACIDVQSADQLWFNN